MSLLLESHSDVLKAMLNSGMKEEREHRIELRHVDPDTFRTLLGFIVSGWLPLTSDTVAEVLALCDQLQFLSAKSRCIRYLQKQLSAETCLVVLDLAERFHCGALVESGTEFLSKCFLQVSSSPEFLSLGSDRLLELAQRRDIGCSTEELFLAVMRWVRHNVDGRGSLLSGLVTAVRLPLLSATLLTELLSEQLLFSHCIGQVQTAVALHSVPARAGELHTCRSAYGRKEDALTLAISRIDERNCILQLNRNTKQ